MSELSTPVPEARPSRLRHDLSGLGISIVLHLVVLAGMAAVTVAHTAPDAMLAIESLFSDDDRSPEEFSRELSESTQIADSINLVEGSGSFTGAVGGSGAPAVHQTKIEESTSLRDPTVTINVGDVTLPGI